MLAERDRFQVLKVGYVDLKGLFSGCKGRKCWFKGTVSIISSDPAYEKIAMPDSLNGRSL